MPERDELDRLIDSELARYAEPRVGLEQRIIAGIDAGSSAQSPFFHSWQPWAFAAAVAIALVLFVSIPRLIHRTTSPNTAHVTIPDHAAARAKAVAPGTTIQLLPFPDIANTTHHVAHASSSNGGAEKTTHPRLEIFPTPQ